VRAVGSGEGVVVDDRHGDSPVGGRSSFGGEVLVGSS